jgi:tagatose-1,6-bisphosphate aldolase non-catalytic subunit AgaZ/GatZ
MVNAAKTSLIFFIRAIIKQGMAKLINLGEKALPNSLLSQFVGSANLNAAQVIEWKINKVLNDYLMACNAN